MSRRLDARRKVQTAWPWSFRGSLCNILIGRYGDKITSDAIPYLEGLRYACADKKEGQYLDDIILALYENDEIELNLDV